MAETFNDDDQVQQLKEWWKQNWQPVLLGLGLSVGGVLGWNAWQSHTQNMAELASGHYEQLRLSLGSGNLEAAKKARQNLVDEYPDSPYAAQASLLMAQYHVERGEYPAAIAHLEWASEQADDKRLRHIATLRLARLYWDRGDDETALALLEGGNQGAFAALYAELRGDILFSQGETERARASYQEAQSLVQENDEMAANGFSNAGLQQKLNDLGGAAAENNGSDPS